jgi:hypothetical protein
LGFIGVGIIFFLSKRFPSTINSLFPMAYTIMGVSLSIKNYYISCEGNSTEDDKELNIENSA